MSGKVTRKGVSRRDADADADKERRRALRQLFIDRAAHYIGTPYSKRTVHHPKADPKYINAPASAFLDCCALVQTHAFITLSFRNSANLMKLLNLQVRKVVRDLSPEFGFQLYFWNQGYQFDTLPIVSSTLSPCIIIIGYSNIQFPFDIFFFCSCRSGQWRRWSLAI